MTDGHEIDQSGVALARPGEAVELVNIVLFVASNESSFFTGAAFIADGGETAGPAAPAGAERELRETASLGRWRMAGWRPGE